MFERDTASAERCVRPRTGTYQRNEALLEERGHRAAIRVAARRTLHLRGGALGCTEQGLNTFIGFARSSEGLSRTIAHQGERHLENTLVTRATEPHGRLLETAALQVL